MTSGNGIRDEFNALVSDLDYPMFIATIRCAGGERAGCLIGFATQCSIEPPRFLLCLSTTNRTCRVGMEASEIAVHFVPSSAEDLAELLGSRTGDEVDKFDLCEWREGHGGVPILVECEN